MPAKLIADNFLKAGFVKDVRPCIERMQAVPKSAGAAAGQRPTVQTHYKSFQVTNTGLFQPEKITIIDDVLTKGCTAFAIAMRLHETFPNAEIKVFAPMRTQGLVADISAIRDPAIGEITYNGYDTARTP